MYLEIFEWDYYENWFGYDKDWYDKDWFNMFSIHKNWSYYNDEWITRVGFDEQWKDPEKDNPNSFCHIGIDWLNWFWVDMIWLKHIQSDRYNEESYGPDKFGENDEYNLITGEKRNIYWYNIEREKIIENNICTNFSIGKKSFKTYEEFIQAVEEKYESEIGSKIKHSNNQQSSLALG